MEGRLLLLPQEIEAFKERAKAELGGKDGEIEFPYIVGMVTISCDKGTAKKIKVASGGVTIYLKI